MRVINHPARLTNGIERDASGRPVYVLRPEDRTTPELLRAMARQVWAEGDREYARALERDAQTMEAWQREHPHELHDGTGNPVVPPDVPPMLAVSMPLRVATVAHLPPAAEVERWTRIEVASDRYTYVRTVDNDNLPQWRRDVPTLSD